MATELTGESSKKAKEHTLTTPDDFINAWCGTQTSSFCENMCTTQAQDLLLCSLGATPRGGPLRAEARRASVDVTSTAQRPRADGSPLNCNTHAGAAGWLQDAAVPLRLQESECIGEEQTALRLDGAVLSSCSSMPASRDA